MLKRVVLFKMTCLSYHFDNFTFRKIDYFTKKQIAAVKQHIFIKEDESDGGKSV